MEHKKLYITLLIIFIIVLCIGGTFALVTTISNAINITQIKAGNLTMTISGGTSENVSFVPSECTGDSAIKKTIVAKATNTSGGKVSFSIGLNITALSDTYKKDTIRYALSTSATSCTKGLIANGSFKDKTANSDLWLIKNDYDNITKSGNTYTKTYYLYIWLDESEEEYFTGNISVKLKGSSSNNPNLTTEAVINIKDTTLYGYMKSNADTTTTINFSPTSESEALKTNGIYMTTDTDSGKPVYYYRGNVDNHVLFANYCWRIVRTTETGGVKLIYNGVQKDVYETTIPIEESSYINVTNDTTYPYTFDSTTKTWVSTNKTHNATGTITFSVDTAGDYVISYVMSSQATYDRALFYKNDTKLEEHSGTENGQIIIKDLLASDVIKIEYSKNSWGSSGNDTVTFSVDKVVGETIKSCNNMGDAATIGNSKFNSTANSPADVGYMYGLRYALAHKNMSSLSGSIVFGNDITYANGTYTLKDTYTLTDVGNWSTEYKTIASKYHYTCFTSSDTCENVNYIHYLYYSSSSSYVFYFKLSEGKNHLDILKEMLDNSTNDNDSEIKKSIDTWYKNNMTDYTSQLEDTVFCNDRSYDVSKSGWNKDYSNTNNLYFNSYQRGNGRKPTLVCMNTNDKFTVKASNGNGALTYPIGLLTYDEITYAGRTNYASFYLYNEVETWTLTPKETGNGSSMITANNSGYGTDVSSAKARPSVSLKPKTEFTGLGTATDPFIVE